MTTRRWSSRTTSTPSPFSTRSPLASGFNPVYLRYNHFNNSKWDVKWINQNYINDVLNFNPIATALCIWIANSHLLEMDLNGSRIAINDPTTAQIGASGQWEIGRCQNLSTVRRINKSSWSARSYQFTIQLLATNWLDVQFASFLTVLVRNGGYKIGSSSWSSSRLSNPHDVTGSDERWRWHWTAVSTH